MPELDRKTLFSGNTDINPDDLGQVEVNNFSTNIDTALFRHFDWNGKALGVIGLTLSPDNSRVAGGLFITRGDTDLSEFQSPCDQIWPEAPASISLAIHVASLNEFTFGSGGLWSDLIPAERFIFSYFDKRDGASNDPILGIKSVSYTHLTLPTIYSV